MRLRSLKGLYQSESEDSDGLDIFRMKNKEKTAKTRIIELEQKTYILDKPFMPAAIPCCRETESAEKEYFKSHYAPHRK